MARPPIALKIVLGREKGDCAVACLATYTGKTYEEALRATMAIVPNYDGACGLHVPEIRAIAKMLGRPLRKKRTVDTDEDSGIMVLSDHVTILSRGTVIDTDGTVWDADDFLQAYDYAPWELLY